MSIYYIQNNTEQDIKLSIDGNLFIFPIDKIARVYDTDLTWESLLSFYGYRGITKLLSDTGIFDLPTVNAKIPKDIPYFMKDGEINNNITWSSEKIVNYTTSEIELGNLKDVTIASLEVGDGLFYDGATFVNKPASVSAGKGVRLYLTGNDVVGTGCEELSSVPLQGEETVETVTVSVSDNDKLLDCYITPEPLNRSSIDPGEWVFNTYAYSDPTDGISKIIIKIYKRSSLNVDTLLFQVDTSDINAILGYPLLYPTRTVQPQFILSTSDKLYIEYVANTDSIESINISLVHSGVEHYSNIETPFSTKHSDLLGLDYSSSGHTGFEPTVTKGDLTETISSVLTVDNGTNSVIGSGTSIQVKKSSISQDGYLSKEDFTTFDNKENAITPKNTAFNKSFETTTSNIKMNSTVSVGESENIARADHVHPKDTSKADDNAVVHLTGTETITGLKTFTNDLKTNKLIFDLTTNEDCAEGEISWDVDNGTIKLGLPGGNVCNQVGQEIVQRVKNTESITIPDGTPIYVSGAQGSNILVKIAKAEEQDNCRKTLYVTTEAISAGHFGYATQIGTVNGIQTSTLAEGQEIFVAVGGGLTSTQPALPNAIVRVGICKVPGNNGKIQVDIMPKSNKDLKFDSGSPTFYFSPNQTMFLSQPCYRDEFPTLLVPAGGAAAPDQVSYTIGGIPTTRWSFDGGNTQETLSGSFEIPHDYQTGGDIEVHLHWLPSTNGGGAVEWFFDWVYLPINSAPVPKTTLSVVDIVSVNQQFYHKIKAIGLLPANGYTLGDKILFNIRRNPSGVNDTYTNQDAILEQIALHIPVDTFGSRQRYIK